MKKLLFILLLISSCVFAQTDTGEEQVFDYGIKNNAAQTVTSPAYITTTSATGTQGKILPANLPVSTQTQIAIDGKVSDTIRNGINSIAPSENAVYDALANKENVANKSDSYTVSSSTTYASTKAVVDGLATKAESTGGTGYIQNKNDSVQSANFNITGTNSYIGTANFYNSPTSLYPSFFKNTATSFNIKGITDQDINIVNQGTGMTTISGGWGLGFKADVAGTSNGPDYGVGVAGINYRPPTESMTKHFLLIRAGQYVFEDDNADWQMIITPTGVNIGGGATPVGGAIPVNKFEVDGNACIGENYDRVYSAPPNGLIVEGSSGFGTYTPSTNFITEFASASALGFPATSGSTQTGGTLRIRNAGSDAVLDIGNNSGSGAWLQSTNRGNLSSNYPLLFNPNGGNVLIGTKTNNGNKLRVNGTGYFDGGVSIPLSNSYSINGGRFVFHNGTTYLGDVDNISPGSSTIIRSGGSDAISITSAGVTRISSLAGTGTRTVVADASGNLAASTIVTSGTYTPTLTNTANITSSSLTNATYTRIGDIVTVNIGFSVDPTAANTNTVLTITLPISRTVSTVLNSGSGAIFQSNTRLPVSFQTSGNTTQGVIYMYPSSTGTYGGSVTFQYNIN